MLLRKALRCAVVLVLLALALPAHATIGTTVNSVIAAGNGITTTFSYSFPVTNLSELVVVYTPIGGPATIIPSSQYTVNNFGTSTVSGQIGGTVTYTISGSPIPTGSTLQIQRIVPFTQLTSISNQGAFYPQAVEAALDLLTMQTQQLAAQASGSTTLPNLGYFTAAGSTTGTANAQVIGATIPTGFALSLGNRVSFIAGVTNAGPTTLATAGTAATPVELRTALGLIAFTGGELLAGQAYTVEFDGAEYELIDPAGPWFSLPNAWTGNETHSGTETFNGLLATGGASTNVFGGSITFNGGSPLTMSNTAINEAETTLASASTVNIGNAAANYIIITGTTTITAFDTVQAGVERTLKFSGALTLTASSSIITANGANIVTTAGTVLKVRSEGSGNWRVVSQLQAGQVAGTATNDNASAGDIGEYVSSTIGSGSAISLTNATAANVTSISLTAGDWDVWANPVFTGNSTTTVTALIGSLSTTTATLNSTPGQRSDMGFNNFAVFADDGFESIPVGPARFSLSATTTIFLVAQSNFSVSTASAYGIIQARRRR
jgi:hypothetical protein